LGTGALVPELSAFSKENPMRVCVLVLAVFAALAAPARADSSTPLLPVIQLLVNGSSVALPG